ncbi:hypothetical protein [Paenibacillus tepidiphilus]|uniref:hypothetical protein n=1 Tax=Paenibacillus tepidiphilus TaxID=2608683 RepID=UPI00123C6E21|nr:hypothetical protein [Paenibacillus tepidiphilus]
MSDPFNPFPPAANSTDPGGHMAKHDTDMQKLQREGAPGLWRQISDLLIVVAIFAVIFIVFRWVI